MPLALRDAEQRARLPRDPDPPPEIVVISCPELPELIDCRLDSPSTEEMNFLASRMEQLTDTQMTAFRALCAVHFANDPTFEEPVPIWQLINMTYGLDDVIVVGDIESDEDIGEFVISNGLNEDVAAVPEKGLDYSHVKEAQVLYILALSDISDQPGFVDTLVSCFWENQSDKQLIDAINSTFGKNIRASDFTKIMEGIRANYIYIPEFTNPGNKNNVDLVIWAKTALNERWGYVWGTFGQVLTSGLLAAKVEQYPDAVGGYYDFIVANWLGNRTADCIGLIKGYSWLDEVTHETVYGSNEMPDIGADQMYEAAIEKGPISTIPEIPGLAVWKPGHIGIYIGNGQVIEAAGTRIGVIQSSLYNGTFTHWLKIPYINYIEEDEEEIPDDDAVIIEDETGVWQ